MSSRHHTQFSTRKDGFPLSLKYLMLTLSSAKGTCAAALIFKHSSNKIKGKEPTTMSHSILKIQNAFRYGGVPPRILEL